MCILTWSWLHMLFAPICEAMLDTLKYFNKILIFLPLFTWLTHLILLDLILLDLTLFDLRLLDLTLLDLRLHDLTSLDLRLLDLTLLDLRLFDLTLLIWYHLTWHYLTCHYLIWQYLTWHKSLDLPLFNLTFTKWQISCETHLALDIFSQYRVDIDEL